MNPIITESKLRPSKFDRNIIYLAKTMALNSKVRGKHASIVVDSNRNIISVGINHHNPKGHLGTRSSIHAECAALNNIKIESNYILYVARSTQSCLGHCYSKPCKECMETILSKRIKTVIYSTNDINEWSDPKMTIIKIKYDFSTTAQK